MQLHLGSLALIWAQVYLTSLGFTWVYSGDHLDSLGFNWTCLVLSGSLRGITRILFGSNVCLKIYRVHVCSHQGDHSGSLRFPLVYLVQFTQVLTGDHSGSIGFIQGTLLHSGDHSFHSDSLRFHLGSLGGSLRLTWVHLCSLKSSVPNELNLINGFS